MGFWSNLFGGSANESATVRAARESGGNISGFTAAVDLLDDAVNMAAQKSGIKFKPGKRGSIRAAFRDAISPDGTDQIVLAQTITTILREAGMLGGPQASLAVPAIPPGYTLVPTASPAPTFATATAAPAVPNPNFGWDPDDLKESTPPAAPEAPMAEEAPKKKKKV